MTRLDDISEKFLTMTSALDFDWTDLSIEGDRSTLVLGDLNSIDISKFQNLFFIYGNNFLT